MKFIAFTLLFFFSSIALMAQKNPLKYKIKPVKIQYYYLPEFDSLRSYKSYTLSLRANEATYQAKIRNGKANAESQVGIDDTYLFGKGKGIRDCDFSIGIATSNQETGDKEMTHTSEKVTNSDGTVSSVKLYNYQIQTTQTVHLTIHDNLRGIKLVDENIEIKDSYDYPKDLGIQMGYANAALLKRNYNSFLSKPDFLKFRNKAMLQDALDEQVRDRIQCAISGDRETVTIRYYRPKTKDVRFEEYLRGCDLMTEGLKTFKFVLGADVPTNAHNETTYNLFNEAYEIFAKYDQDYVLELLGNEAFAKEFTDQNLTPLFVSALFSSRYEEATRTFENAINAKKNETNNSNEETGEVKQVLSSLANDLKADNSSQGRIAVLIPILLHEVKYYDLFKTQYGYFR